MRIAYYVPNPSYVESPVGGDAVMARSLWQGLAERGHDVRLVSRFPSGAAASPRAWLAAVRAVRREVRAFAPDAWLVYSPSVHEPDVFGWWQRPRRYVLFGAHAAGPLRGRSRSGGELLRWLVHRRSLARASSVVAWRPRSADKLRAAGIREPRLTVLLPAARAWPDSPERADARRRLGLPPTAPVVLCATRFAMRRPGAQGWKKTDMCLELIELFEQVRDDAVLLLVGDEGRGLPTVRERAAAVSPPGRVRVDVSLDHDAMRDYFAACDVYVYWHPKDTPWVSVLEAQLCGRAVVLKRDRSAELMVEHGSGGLLADDRSQFVQHLERLLADRARCDELGRRGQRHVAATHSLEVRVGQVEQLLSSGRLTAPAPASPA